MLPVLSKVNERLAHKQFVTFLDHDGKLSKFQSGNHKYHSSQTAFVCVKAMDEKKISLLVLMDMSKAFESINHDMLAPINVKPQGGKGGGGLPAGN